MNWAQDARKAKVELFVKERAQYEYYRWPDSDATYQIFDLAPSNNGVDEEPSARLVALKQAGAEVVMERDGVTLLRVDQAVLSRAATGSQQGPTR